MHWKPFESCNAVQQWSPTKFKACFTLLISDAFLYLVFESALLYHVGNSAVLGRYQNLIQNRFGVQSGSFLENLWVSTAERTGGLKDWQMSDHEKNQVFENCHFMFQSVLIDCTWIVYLCFNCCACSTEYECPDEFNGFCTTGWLFTRLRMELYAMCARSNGFWNKTRTPETLGSCSEPST